MEAGVWWTWGHDNGVYVSVLTVSSLINQTYVAGFLKWNNEDINKGKLIKGSGHKLERIYTVRLEPRLMKEFRERLVNSWRILIVPGGQLGWRPRFPTRSPLVTCKIMHRRWSSNRTCLNSVTVQATFQRKAVRAFFPAWCCKLCLPG